MNFWEICSTWFTFGIVKSGKPKFIKNPAEWRKTLNVVGLPGPLPTHVIVFQSPAMKGVFMNFLISRVKLLRVPFWKKILVLTNGFAALATIIIRTNDLSSLATKA